MCVYGDILDVNIKIAISRYEIDGELNFDVLITVRARVSAKWNLGRKQYTYMVQRVYRYDR